MLKSLYKIVDSFRNSTLFFFKVLKKVYKKGRNFILKSLYNNEGINE